MRFSAFLLKTAKDVKKLSCRGKIKLFRIMISEGNIIMNKATARENIKPGASVEIVLKQDQKSGKITRGIVKRILRVKEIHS